MHWVGDGIVCAVLPHGEHGAVVRLFSADEGIVAGYVKAARATRNRAIWLPGNSVQAEIRQRAEGQLGSLTGDLTRSRADLFFAHPASGAAISWITSLVAFTLPERLAQPQLYVGLKSVLEIMSLSEDMLQWATAIVRFELLLLSELGFGLDFSSCAATGATDDLIYISPKSAQAVSRSAGLPYHAQMLPLPFFVRGGVRSAESWREVRDGFFLTGYFIERHVLPDSKNVLVQTRRQFLERLPVAEA
jgi:DNA repair protein RecO (recombination protein O)